MIREDKINGVVVRSPQNAEDAEIEINFDTDNDQQSVSISSYIWGEEESDRVRAAFLAGLSGGTGVFEGLPHTITVREGSSTLSVFEGYIDLTTAQFDEDRVTADSVLTRSVDWIADNAEFNFDYLLFKGYLSVNDTVFVPYVVASVPNYTDTMVTILTIVYVTTELKALIQEILIEIGKLGTVVATIGGVIGLIGKLVYAVALLITIIDLVLDLIALIIQKVKYKPSLNVNTMIEAACSFLGMTYQSSILQDPTWSKLHLIPESFANPSDQTDNRIQGFLSPNRNTQSGFYRGTFGDLLRGIQDTFNARIFPDNGVLRIEPAKVKPTSASFQIKPIYQPKYTTNAGEVVSNHTLSFAYDTVEKQTVDRWTGNNVQAQLEPVVVNDRTMRVMKGHKPVTLPWARGIEKISLTAPEEVADALLDVLGLSIGIIVTTANAVIDTVNKAIDTFNKLKRAIAFIIDIGADTDPVPRLIDPQLGDLIDGRIGVLLLETDMITVPKLVLLNVSTTDRNTKLAPENLSHLRALYLWQTFHATNSFAPTSNSAQRYVWNYEKVEMNLADVINVINERAVKLSSGEVVDVLSCKWNHSTRLATFVLHEWKLYTNNLKEVISEPSGY